MYAVVNIINVVLSLIVLASVFPFAGSAYTGVAKPMEFYLHYFDTPVSVAGLQTKYVMNTTRSFRFATQQEAYANSFYKPIGQPKIVVDFYLYPNFAGQVTLNGNWQVFMWVNGSAYKPAGFTLEFKEVAVGGAVLWDSGQLGPTVTSTVGEYLGVPVYDYNLSVPLSHTFSVGTTLLVEVEVNAGSSVETRIWYDSPLYPSKVILPAEDYARPTTIKTYAVDNSETTLFQYNWSEKQRTVIVRANVTDPFGGYDIYRVNTTIFDPTGNAVVKNREMIRVSNGQWITNYAHVFELNWSYPTTAELGNYTVIVSVIDNNGYYRSIDTGSVYPFVEEESTFFTIGIITYYDPSFRLIDDLNDPLLGAQVYITWKNGTRDIAPHYTLEDGFINLTHVEAGNYGFTVFWKGVLVNQTTVHVDSNGPYNIRTQVFQLTVQVYGNNDMRIHGAYVIVYTEAGVGYGLEITDANGTALFKLPSGNYRLEAHYTSDYWLTVVKTVATQSVSVSTSASKSIILADFPPAIWSTAGFMLLIALIIAMAVAISFALYVKHKKAKPR